MQMVYRRDTAVDTEQRKRLLEVNKTKGDKLTTSSWPMSAPPSRAYGGPAPVMTSLARAARIVIDERRPTNSRHPLCYIEMLKRKNYAQRIHLGARHALAAVRAIRARTT
jgi:hypothetical protein